jgi:hypothetical protein
VRVFISVSHTTNRHEPLGDDEFEPLELCAVCGKLYLDLIPLRLIRKSDEPMMERDIEAPPLRVEPFRAEPGRWESSTL